LLIVLMLAFARNDPKFLSEAVLMLAGEERRADLDLDALEREFAEFIERFQVGSLREIQIGPMLEGMIRIASRHGLRLPASLALSGKAFGQVQLAIAELDPLHLYYEGQKLRLRLVRFVEAVERATGARPGPKLQVDFLGSEGIEQAIGRAGRRLSLAAATAALLVGAAATAAAGTAGWISI